MFESVSYSVLVFCVVQPYLVKQAGNQYSRQCDERWGGQRPTPNLLAPNKRETMHVWVCQSRILSCYYVRYSTIIKLKKTSSSSCAAEAKAHAKLAIPWTKPIYKSVWVIMCRVLAVCSVLYSYYMFKPAKQKTFVVVISGGKWRPTPSWPAPKRTDKGAFESVSVVYRQCVLRGRAMPGVTPYAYFKTCTKYIYRETYVYICIYVNVWGQPELVDSFDSALFDI